MWTPWKPKPPRPRPQPQHPVSDKHALRLVAGAVLINPGCTLADLERDTGLPRPRITALLTQLRDMHVVTDDWVDALSRNLCRYRPLIPKG